MEIAITARIRSGPLLRFRRERKLTQRAAGALAEVSQTMWCAIESHRFDRVTWPALCRVAGVVGVEPDVICPESCRGQNLLLERTVYRQTTAELIYAEASRQRMLPSAPEVEADKRMVIEMVQDRMTDLTARQRRVVTLRYGLDGHGDRTWEEIGKAVGVTRERVRQIEAKAIRCLQFRPELVAAIGDVIG